MAPSKADVHAMVAALFTLTAGMERARRQRKAAGTLSLLQLIADRRAIRPSELADLQDVHPSLVTRQVRELEDAGHVQVAADPADGRSCLVTLTPGGRRRAAAADPGRPGPVRPVRGGLAARRRADAHRAAGQAQAFHGRRRRAGAGAAPGRAALGRHFPTGLAGQASLPPNGGLGLRAHPDGREELSFGCGASRHENRPGLAPYRRIFCLLRCT